MIVNPVGNPLGNPTGKPRNRSGDNEPLGVAKKTIDIDCSPKTYETTVYPMQIETPPGFRKIRVTVYGRGGDGAVGSSTSLAAGGGGGGCSISPILSAKSVPVISIPSTVNGWLNVTGGDGLLSISIPKGGNASANVPGIGAIGAGGEFNYKGGDGCLGSVAPNYFCGGGGGGATPDGPGMDAMPGAGVGGDSGSGPNTAGFGGRGSMQASRNSRPGNYPNGGGGGAYNASVAGTSEYTRVLGAQGMVRIELW